MGQLIIYVLHAFMSDVTILVTLFIYSNFTQGVSVANRLIQLKNKFKLRLSWKGYAKLEQVILKEMLVGQETYNQWIHLPLP